MCWADIVHYVVRKKRQREPEGLEDLSLTDVEGQRLEASREDRHVGVDSEVPPREQIGIESFG